jgi:hypothetical protein
VEQPDGRFYSEGDGKFCDRAVHRYVLSLKAMDASGDVYLNLFNEQVRQLCVLTIGGL